MADNEETTTMSSIVMSYPTEPGICSEQECQEPATESVRDDDWHRWFDVCSPHARRFEGIQRRQREAARCSESIPAQDNGNRPPSPPDWCVRPAGHGGDHRMWSAARHA